MLQIINLETQEKLEGCIEDLIKLMHEESLNDVNTVLRNLLDTGNIMYKKWKIIKL